MKLFVQGVLIHASIRRTLIYKFQSEIKEDKVYSIQSFSDVMVVLIELQIMPIRSTSNLEPRSIW